MPPSKERIASMARKRHPVTQKGYTGQNLYWQEKADGSRRYIGVYKQKLLHPDRSTTWRTLEVRADSVKEAKRLRDQAVEAGQEAILLDEFGHAVTDPAPDSDTTTVVEWVRKVEENRTVKRSEQSRKRDDSLRRKHIEQYTPWGKLPISAVRKLTVQSWVRNLQSGRLAPSTILHIFGILNRAFREAVANDLIDKNPAEGINLEAPDYREHDFLEVEEIKELADAMPARYRVAVLVGGFGGLRWGEVSGLTLDDLFAEDEVPHLVVLHSLQRDTLALKEPKTASSVRPVTLTPELVEALQGHLRFFPSEQEEPCSSNECPERIHHGLVFTGDKGGPVRYHHFRDRIWNPTCEKVLGRRIRFHLLRHSHTRQLQDAGLDAWDVAARLGHRQLATTTRYTKQTLSRQAVVAERLAEVQAG